ncbi:hypothetical protein KUW15_07865 [Qipengyuania aquimaris]|uniref:hypothetical protein n=1 Tax=Qipengyuania aquimaris TaxID=255984 RepID=UPI001C973C46|nr:hypothetical protein [Qipengyuania aquimaris]MBY6128626.1 hypothetical protein [Qipengyuania aquimaris]
MLKKIALIAVMPLMLTACGSNGAGDGAAQGPTGDGVPQVDTGWNTTTADGSLTLQRQLNQLTLSYTMAKSSEGVKGTLVAKAAPCLNGKGEETVETTFTPMTSDDASALSDVRDRIDSAVGRLSARCTFPAEVREDITAGFDGLYFRSAPERAAISGS